MSVDDTIRATLERRVQPVQDPDVIVAEVERRRGRRRQRRRAARVLVAAATVAVLGVGAVVVGGPFAGSDADNVRAGQAEQGPGPGEGQPPGADARVTAVAVGLGPLHVSTSGLATPRLGWLEHTVTIENTGSETIYVNDHRTGQFLGDREILAADEGCTYGHGPGEPVEVGCFTDYRPVTLEPGAVSTFGVTLWRDLAGMNEVTGTRFDFRQPIVYATTPFTGPDQPGTEGELVLTYEGLPPPAAPAPVVPPMPAGEGPSQSPAEAARDRVLPEVAALGDRLRSTRLVSLETAGGYWTISWAPQEMAAGGSGVLGDPSGQYGIDWVQAAEYSEILLLDRDGRITRAYPMPGMVPSWIHLTEDALYAGRIGDGALPASSIVRIDLATGAGTVVVFPGDGHGPVLGLGWRPAPAGASVEDYVTTGAPPDGTPVASWIGEVRIDLEAMPRLFD